MLGRDPLTTVKTRTLLFFLKRARAPGGWKEGKGGIWAVLFRDKETRHTSFRQLKIWVKIWVNCTDILEDVFQTEATRHR